MIQIFGFTPLAGHNALVSLKSSLRKRSQARPATKAALESGKICHSINRGEGHPLSERPESGITFPESTKRAEEVDDSFSFSACISLILAQSSRLFINTQFDHPLHSSKTRAPRGPFSGCLRITEHRADITEAHNVIPESEGPVISHLLGGSKKGAQRGSGKHTANADALHSDL